MCQLGLNLSVRFKKFALHWVTIIYTEDHFESLRHKYTRNTFVLCTPLPFYHYRLYYRSFRFLNPYPRLPIFDGPGREEIFRNSTSPRNLVIAFSFAVEIV